MEVEHIMNVFGKAFNRYAIYIQVIVYALLFLYSVPVKSQSRVAIHAYAPSHWLSCIGFPDDWQKTLVDQDGALAYNFGPGPYAEALTTVNIGLKDVSLSRQQQFMSNYQIPIATTLRTGGDVHVKQQNFAIISSSAGQNSGMNWSHNVQREYGLNGAVDWSDVPDDIDPAFRDVAWGTNRPIKYDISVSPSSRKMIALGFSDSRYSKPGYRALEVIVEGAEHRLVDPAAAGKNVAQAFLFKASDRNGDGKISIEVKAAQNGTDPNTILNAIWMFPEDYKISKDDLIHGKLNSGAEAYVNCGDENEMITRPVRRDAILAHFTGKNFTPVITVHTIQHFDFDKSSETLTFRGRPFLVSRPAIVDAKKTDHGWILSLPENTQKAEVMVIHGDDIATKDAHIPNLEQEEEKAVNYWTKTNTIPHNRIVVPDSGIQYVLDANIRNLYQIREKVDGHIQFQPGPSVYRGQWVHDSIMMMDAALFLGDTSSVRQAIEGLFPFQKSDGQVEVMSPHLEYRETPVFVFMMTHYANITGNTTWLNHHWNRIERGIQWMKEARDKTLSDPDALYYGLFPPGFTDGGLAGVTAEYSSVYWSFIGLNGAISAAKKLGKKEDARGWQKFYDNLMASFKIAAHRDMKKDRFGNWYLPVKVGSDGSEPPQQAQWSVCEAQYYGHVFPQHDSLITGSLDMLHDHTEEGMVTSVGWLENGIWNWYAGIQGMANAWEGRCDEAADILYAFANHSNPLGTWVEEQLPRKRGTRTTGDVSNASGSGQFIDLTRRLLLIDRDSTLDILPCMPRNWVRAGARLELNDLPTGKGRITLHLTISNDGHKGRLTMQPLGHEGMSGHAAIHLNTLKTAGYTSADGSPLPTELITDWGTPVTLNFVR